MGYNPRHIAVIESPFGGEVCENVAYARACLADSLGRGEVLDDNDPAERKLGMDAGWAFFQVASVVAVYTDRGISNGMREGIALAKSLGVPVDERSLRDRTWEPGTLAFPPGAADEPGLVGRADLAKDIRLFALRSSPLIVRRSLEVLADSVERDDL